MEITQLLFHLRVLVSAGLVNQIFFTCLSNTELQRFLTETQVLSRNETVQKDVDTWIVVNSIELDMMYKQTNLHGRTKA